MDSLTIINDRHGHLVGSHCLKRVARTLQITCRFMDTAARHAGDEFALVLPEADAPAGCAVAERVSHSVATDAQASGIPVISVWQCSP